MDHHCCDPAHRDLEKRIRRLTERLQEAQSRARWAELSEAAMAAEMDRLEKLGRLDP